MPKVAIKGGEPLRTKPFPGWPVFGEREVEALEEVCKSGVWGIGGKKKPELEEKFAELHDAKYGVAVTSGTVALQIALKAAGVGAGDEVIIPAYTFIATASAPLAINAIPVFVDIEPDTYNIDPEKVEAAITDKTKAIIPVHIAGRPADMDAIMQIAQKYNLMVIEDAAQAHCAEWKGRKVGAIGDAGCFSFQSSKNISAGEGGIILTDDKALEERCWSLHNCGRIKEGAWYEHHLLGGNYRMTEWQAAILLVQMERATQQAELRNRNAQYLDSLIAQIDGLTPMRQDPRITKQAYHLYIFRYDCQKFDDIPRQKFIEAVNAEGIPVYGGYSGPLHKEPVFAVDMENCPFACHFYEGKINYKHQEFPITERACREEALWLSQTILLGSKADMDDIIKAILKVKENIDELKST